MRWTKRIIPSGSWGTASRGEQAFEALLGACVGVTLVDREAGVGGLIHLLLPEPAAGGVQVWAGEKYASHGLPRFIAELEALGARPEGMSAALAGGALLGPLTEMDISLDIGGRTLAVAESILAGRGIPVVQSETGGYLSCRMALELDTLETHISPLFAPPAGPPEDFRRPSARDIDQAIGSVRPIPQIALKICRMLQAEDYSMAQVAGQVRQDQIISGRVLNLVNSPLVGLRSPVDSIDHALIILGERMLLKLVLSASLEPIFPETQGGYSLSKGGLFQHALAAGVLAEELARLDGAVPPALAYTAGLLHDIGKVALDQYVGQAMPLFYRHTLAQGEHLASVERRILGVTHAEAGGRLAEAWGLPETLRQVIMFHHYPEMSQDHGLTNLVYLADLLLSRFRAGVELDLLNAENLAPRLKKAGLGAGALAKVIDHIPRAVFHTD